MAVISVVSVEGGENELLLAYCAQLYRFKTKGKFKERILVFYSQSNQLLLI